MGQRSTTPKEAFNPTQTLCYHLQLVRVPRLNVDRRKANRVETWAVSPTGSWVYFLYIAPIPLTRPPLSWWHPDISQWHMIEETAHPSALLACARALSRPRDAHNKRELMTTGTTLGATSMMTQCDARLANDYTLHGLLFNVRWRCF